MQEILFYKCLNLIIFLPYVAHINPTIETMNRKKNNNFVCAANNIIRQIISANVVGKRQ